jgi:hypothetical protein
LRCWIESVSIASYLIVYYTVNVALQYCVVFERNNIYEYVMLIIFGEILDDAVSNSSASARYSEGLCEYTHQPEAQCWFYAAMTLLITQYGPTCIFNRTFGFNRDVHRNEYVCTVRQGSTSRIPDLFDRYYYMGGRKK